MGDSFFALLAVEFARPSSQRIAAESGSRKKIEEETPMVSEQDVNEKLTSIMCAAIANLSAEERAAIAESENMTLAEFDDLIEAWREGNRRAAS